jgi:NADPH2:quinone reductase
MNGWAACARKTSWAKTASAEISRMKIIQLRQPGGPEVLEYTDVPLPVPGVDQVRVRACAIGVGKPDVLIRQGSYKWMPPMPAVPGNELAGVVDAVGAGVSSALMGQRVLVSSRELPQRGGCYAEAVCVPAAALYALPDAVSFDAAVSMPNVQLAGALLYESGARPPKSILVHGAAGGVAGALLQLAQADGLLAIGTVSDSAKFDFARASGAQHLIHRATQNVHEAVMTLTNGRGVDMVLDHVGGPDFTANLDLLAARGTLLSYNALAGLPDQNLLGEMRRLLGKSLGVRCYSIHTLDAEPELRRALMERAIDLAAQGRVKTPRTMTLPLSAATQAHQMLDAAQVLGKLVLKPGTVDPVSAQ